MSLWTGHVHSWLLLPQLLLLHFSTHVRKNNKSSSCYDMKGICRWFWINIKAIRGWLWTRVSCLLLLSGSIMIWKQSVVGYGSCTFHKGIHIYLIQIYLLLSRREWMFSLQLVNCIDPIWISICCMYVTAKWVFNVHFYFLTITANGFS